MSKIINSRQLQYDCNDIFPMRWSPRAMSGEAVSDQELNILFEAAHWAPSCFNNQPWRFLFAKKDSKHWEIFFNLLSENNKLWCKQAGVLLVIVAKMTFDFDDAPDPTFAFDTGAAWENLALQASMMGLVCHGMAGFDHEKAKNELHVPENYKIMAMAAIGKPGKKEDLPENLREREMPSERKSIDQIILEGGFKTT